MDQTVKTFTSEGADARKWIGRNIMAGDPGGGYLEPDCVDRARVLMPHPTALGLP